MVDIESIRRRLRNLYNRPTPIKPSHTYTDKLTGEQFIVKSVGHQVRVERKDAQRRPNNSIPREILREAIAKGIVVHEQHRCKRCPDNV